jgi:hypothetical protein
MHFVFTVTQEIMVFDMKAFFYCQAGKEGVETHTARKREEMATSTACYAVYKL